jgi:ACS family sodium-dependent inorganic phosphate cotransporter
LGLAISYADRSNIAIAIIPMSKEFGWTPAIEGAIFSCFFYGYMATQVLGGYLADKFGGKWVFGAGALGWSIFTLLTPLAAKTHFGLLIAVRVLLGVAEGKYDTPKSTPQ